MCRMFGYVGESREELKRLLDGLKKAAKNDTIAAALKLDRVHRDGWGFAMYSEGGMSLYKSAKAVFEDDSALPPTDGTIAAIFHARQASSERTISNRFSHPFFGDTRESFLFLAHNGSLDENGLKKELGFGGEAIDSELALKYLTENGLGAAGALEAFTKPNSALDLLILDIDRRGGKADVLVKQFYNRVEAEEDKTSYYRLFTQDMVEGVAVFSSTFNDYGFSGDPVETSRLVSLRTLASNRPRIRRPTP